MRCILVLAMALQMMGASEEAAVKKVLDDQVTAWNRGDLDEFVKSYLNAPDITFVGKAVSRGYQGVVDRYRANYGDKQRMGTLRFDEVEIKMLGKDYALVLGKFALDRSAAGGGPSSGRYTLVARKTKDGWKLIHDHTSN